MPYVLTYFQTYTIQSSRALLINEFRKPDRGVQLLIHWGFVEDSPQAIAKLFLGRRGLSKQMIGEFLGTLHSPFHAAVLE